MIYIFSVLLYMLIGMLVYCCWYFLLYWQHTRRLLEGVSLNTLDDDTTRITMILASVFWIITLIGTLGYFIIIYPFIMLSKIIIREIETFCDKQYQIKRSKRKK